MAELELIDTILLEGLDDWIPAGTVARAVQHVTHARTGDEVREVGIHALGILLAKGLIAIGDVLPESGYQPWLGSQRSILERVRTEWGDFDPSDPSGEPAFWNFWVSLTPKGMVAARAVEARAT